MPAVEKADPIEAVVLERDILLPIEGGRAKPIAAGSIQLTNLRTGAQWYISWESFQASGWAPKDPDRLEYYERRVSAIRKLKEAA